MRAASGRLALRPAEGRDRTLGAPASRSAAADQAEARVGQGGPLVHSIVGVHGQTLLSVDRTVWAQRHGARDTFWASRYLVGYQIL